jgi:hypothetical protein
MVKRLKLYLLRDAESVVDLDYEIAGGAFELRMSGSALLWWTGPDRRRLERNTSENSPD